MEIRLIRDRSRVPLSGPAILGFALVFLGLSVTALGQATEPNDHDESGIDCGEFALSAFLRFRGKPARLDDVGRKVRQTSSPGHSMDELRDAAAELGLPLEAVTIGKDQTALEQPLIAFLKSSRGEGGHYVAIRPVGHTGRLVQVVDSLQPAFVLDKADIVSRPEWTGLVLVLGRTNWPARIGIGALAGLLVGALASLRSYRPNRWLRSVG